jgi:GNAT superfamily N-acetyltransferase
MFLGKQPRAFMEWTHETFTISCDPAKLDQALITQFLSTSYWAAGIPSHTVSKSLANSLCFGVFERDAEPTKQVGFARVISDYATVAYLGDVFILEQYRGRGLSKWLMQCIGSHPELQGLRRWLLATRDAHALYSKFGFTALQSPERFMERHDPAVYG